MDIEFDRRMGIGSVLTLILKEYFDREKLYLRGFEEKTRSLKII
jgi:hypothetical protein